MMLVRAMRAIASRWHRWRVFSQETEDSSL